MKRCFQVHPSDNVAVLLEDAAEGPVNILGGSAGVINLKERIPLGHKVALANIDNGMPVIKFGVPIGVATTRIAPGEWVHLHNCRSRVDERSSRLDIETGAARDTPYE
ncbi:MAG TPA: UxaA family hydrolase [Bryobacteraceae bacterium]|nr:UxaA family hydrolase [Bryobacteraceae bacterium]